MRRQLMALPNHQKPDIILFMTDQQRFDTIRALGYPYMITPNLDRKKGRLLPIPIARLQPVFPPGPVSST